MKKTVEQRLAAIEARNARVELDKQWETSLTRRLTIAGLSYFVVAFYLIIINKDRPFVNALVPAIAYLLSTLILKRIRLLWQNYKS